MKELYVKDIRGMGNDASVILLGWVSGKRSHGNVAFLDIVDSTGSIQVVANRASVEAADFEVFKKVSYEAVSLLMKEGFNAVNPDGTTRLGFDMVISSLNIHEVPRTLEFCRKNNIWIVFSFYLPAGLSARESFDQNLQPNDDQKNLMRLDVRQVDAKFGFNHPIWSNFATGPCVERLQIYGDGRVSPCPGNETIIGNIREQSVRDLHRILLDKFPGHNPLTFKGHCLYRPPL